MQETSAQIWESVGGFLPNLLGALAILIGGWFVARILGAVVRGALKRVKLDNRLSKSLFPGAGEDFQVERAAGKSVFYLVMLFVLVAFFQALGLELITEPLNALLTQLSEFAPRLLGALGLLVVAWLVATVLRRLVAGGLSAARFDERLGETTEGPTGDGSLSHTLAEAVYWLVFLLFLPAILGALAVEGLLAPVEGMADQILGFLPNLFGAAVILAVGWFVARLVQRIVSNLLAAAGADSLPERIGWKSAPDAMGLSRLVGILVYVLILVPVVISSLNALQMDAITGPASAMLESILGSIPGLFAGGLVLVIAFVVGKLVSGLIATLLESAGFDGIPTRLGFKEAGLPGGRSLSGLVGSLVLLAIMTFAAIEASNMVGFQALGEIFNQFVFFAGQVVLGLIVFGIGLWLANLAHSAVMASGASQAKLLALAARVSILVLAGAMGLRQMGVGEQIIELAFGLLLGAIAVAVALAFGLGARDVAGDQVRSWFGRGGTPSNEGVSKEG
ncbi:MAG: mechanosensitive ion channel [Gemmatimonadetes bacterium]|nr:mechanosensitive ion channel [Gemmatimonadota bacterium]NNM06057.1 mechanosensitive ion channel [Gemmatimonadota bacterium]